MIKSLIMNHRNKIIVLFMIFISLIMPVPKAQISNTDPLGNSTGTTDVSVPVKDITVSSAFEYTSKLNNAQAIMAQCFSNMQTAAFTISNAPGITQLAKIFIYFFGLFALVLPMGKAILGGESGVEEFITNLLGVGIFVGLFTSYSDVVKALIGMMNDLATAVSGGSQTTTDSLIKVVGNMIDGFKANVPGPLSFLEKSAGYLFMVVILGFINIIVSLIALFFIFIYTNVGRAMIAVAIAIGPVFIACGVWEVTRHIFDKWLQFLLVAGMYQVVSNVILALISGVAFIPANATAQNFASEPYAIATMFQMLTLAYLSSMIPEIASALLPGHIAGASGAGKMAVKVLMPKGSGGSGGNSGGSSKGGSSGGNNGSSSSGNGTP